MKKPLTAVLIIFLAFITLSFNGVNSSEIDCTVLHHGTFMYADEKQEPVRVVIDGKNHTEYHNKGKYYIKSEIKWINDCEYTTKIKKVTVPRFPLKPGTVMKVSIDNVEGNAIFCTGMINNQSFSSKLIKMED